MKNFFKLLLILFSSIIIFENTFAEDKQKMDTGHKYNVYTGMFDFSDEGKKSQILGIQHLNDNLFRDSFIGTIKPVTGFMLTADSASYLYTGIQAEYNIGKFNILWNDENALIFHTTSRVNLDGKSITEVITGSIFLHNRYAYYKYISIYIYIYIYIYTQ